MSVKKSKTKSKTSLTKDQKKKEIERLLFDAPKNERLYFLEQSPMHFAIYYFPEFFTFKMADFHTDIYQDYKDLYNGDIRQIMHKAFRESAKSSIAKIMIIYAICFERKKYINWDSYDKKNAEQALFDVAFWLQQNKQIISDFGHLYNEDRSDDKKTKKRVSDFITSNGIRVEAHSTQESVRGRIFGETRPDMFVFDDFETSVTKGSVARTEQVVSHIDEAISGMSPTASIVYLCNYITESGSVAHIENKLRDDPNSRFRDIPVVENPIYKNGILVGGDITWEAKYCFTDEEASETGKVSLQSRQREIDDFEAEMMNNPSRSDQLWFDRDKVEEALKNCEEPVNKSGNLFLWQDGMKDGERYGIGGDVSAGVGLDASASAIWNFTTGELIGTYVNNQVSPDLFAHELKRQGDMFGTCIIAPENNAIGAGTIVALKQIYQNIYTMVRKEMAMDRLTSVLGWNTNAKTKPNMFSEFKTAFERGLVKIKDKRVLEEMKYYSYVDLETTKNSPRLASRHYDLLTAVVIGWQMKNHAHASESVDESLDRWEEMRNSREIKNNDAY